MPDSWWLKVKRAQKHMVELELAVRAYSDRHPYEFTRVKEPERKRKISYRVHAIEQPDPMIAVILGDFVHNLRSALDHVIVASVPKERRKSAFFPVAFEDIWATDSNGRFVVDDAKQRESFKTGVTGLHADALAIVVGAQPYMMRGETEASIIGLLSRLENADKHRRLITVAGGISRPRVILSLRNQTVRLPDPPSATRSFCSLIQ